MAEAYRAWRYQLDQDFTRKVPSLDGVVFSNQWLSVVGGVLTVRRAYAWDGCSPAWNVPVFGWIGPPDGPPGKDGLPWAYYPTLVHDALCQFRSGLAVDKATVVALLHEMLLEYGFPKWAALLYTTAVNLLGPQDWPGRPQPDAA